MLVSLLALATAMHPMIIPKPDHMEVLSGNWELTAASVIGYESSMEGAEGLAKFIATELKKSTGFDLKTQAGMVAHGIYLGSSPAVENDEGYQLTMTSDVVTIVAKKRAGLFYGFQSLLQLLPVEIYSKTVKSQKWTAPCCTIVDYPRFKWRGCMLDPCRHFIELNTVFECIDGLSRFKINTVHIHLTEDQGWRIELKKYPKLTEIGSKRDFSPKMWDRNTPDNTPYGPYFYTVEEIKQIIEYARERSITIVPELEMPGHGLAALSAYPEFSCTGGPFKPRCWWGVEEDVWCAGNDEAIKMLESLVDEFCDIFDSEFFHVGGDECPKTRWKSCPKCQKRIKDQGLANEDQLQRWVIQHFSNYLAAKGRRLIGWDEILEGGLADGAAVMSWRGTSGGEAAARAGHDVVMSPNSALYLDYGQFPVTEPYEYICCLSNLWMCYHYNPTAGIEEEFHRYVIGVQGNLWSEYIWGHDDLQWKMFPREMAIGEVGWAQDSKKDWADFIYRVVNKGFKVCETLGLNHAPVTLGDQQEWKSGEVPSDRWVTKEWTFGPNINDDANYGCEFVWTGGNNALKIRNVQLKYDGQVIRTDAHEGYAGAISKDIAYLFNTPGKPGNKKVTISAEVMADGGSDSTGVVLLYRA